MVYKILFNMVDVSAPQFLPVLAPVITPEDIAISFRSFINLLNRTDMYKLLSL